jgi:hypothetical protein
LGAWTDIKTEIVTGDPWSRRIIERIIFLWSALNDYGMLNLSISIALADGDDLVSIVLAMANVRRDLHNFSNP